MHLPPRARAQALVEFALAAVLLLSLLLATVDFARGYITQVAIKGAVAKAGYFAAQNPRDDAGIRVVLRGELPELQPALQDGDITIARDCTSGDERTTIRVRYQLDLLFSFVIPSATVMLGSETTVPQLGQC